MKVRSLAALIVIYGITQAVAQKVPTFSPRDYPSSQYLVTQASHTLGDVTIQIIQAKRRKPDGSAPHFCRAWVDVSRGEKLLRRIYYSDMEAVGASYGVFVPAIQPSADYFALVKEGDYDGRLLLVDRQGVVTNLLGGFFFVTADGRFIVSQYSSDETGLAVFDLQAHRTMLQSKEVPYQNWYKDGLGYFFAEDDSPEEENTAIYRLNLKTAKLLKSTIDPKRLQAAHKVRFDFDPRQFSDCVSR